MSAVRADQCPGNSFQDILAKDRGEVPEIYAEAPGVDLGGADLSAHTDSEVMDVIEYNLSLNLVLFAGFGSPPAYRVRPDCDYPQGCLFEVYMRMGFRGERPEDAQAIWLEPDQKFASVAALSYFGPVLDQDADLMPRVQRGLRSSHKGAVTLSRYQESCIPHFRSTSAEYVGAGT